MIDLAAVEVVTFDCYGTLIDWESGILKESRKLLGADSSLVTDPTILDTYGRIESALESGSYRTYREVLTECAQRIAKELGSNVTHDQCEAFADSIRTWQPFPDTVEALKSLKKTCRLGILSNVDDELFAVTSDLLQVEFDFVVTAQQVGSYKPNYAHFIEAERRVGLNRDSWLHAAQSLHHDIAPCNALNIHNCWVHRPSRNGDFGAVLPAECTPQFQVPDLATLATMISSGK